MAALKGTPNAVAVLQGREREGKGLVQRAFPGLRCGGAGGFAEVGPMIDGY